MKSKVGDTLIEVTLAIGIFSMVAIAVASVVNGSTSSAQIALETTITREEIDAQAEALRFIHASYIAGGASNEEGEDKYLNLWREIVKRAKNRSESLEYIPTTCAELYENDSLANQGAFIINTHNLSSDNLDDIIIAPIAGSSSVFYTASTYPRIIYAESIDEDDTIIGQGVGTTVARVEGLYVVPIKDEQTTTIVDSSGITKKAAYYDFYIRSCWFGPGADRPSTISTVIRLYDPNVIEY